jgi:hypothetical protein
MSRPPAVQVKKNVTPAVVRTAGVFFKGAEKFFIFVVLPVNSS